MSGGYRKIKNHPQTEGVMDIFKGMSQEEKTAFEQTNAKIDQMNTVIRDLQMNINSLNSNNTYLRESFDILNKQFFEIQRLSLPQPTAPPMMPTPSAPPAAARMQAPSRFKIGS